jgi:lactate permease
MVSWSETLEVLPAILVTGISFAGMQFFWSNYMDSNLVDIAAGVTSMIAMLVFLRFWKPKKIWRFEEERDTPLPVSGRVSAGVPSKSPIVVDQMDDEWDVRQLQQSRAPRTYTGGEIARAWLPFAILSIFVLLWGLPTVKNAMGRATTPAFKTGGWEVPYLHKAVFRAQPVVSKPTAENAKFDFNWLTATGTGCFFAAIFSGLIIGVKPRKLMQIFGRTLYRMRYAIVAMSCMLGLGYVTRYSGMDAVLGLAFTRTGWLFPFFGTYIGWLGVALTGSDTSSNALFGGLQRITAEQLNLSPILMCATNSAGGVMGKMVDAQSITVATAATNQVGNEGIIFRWVFWHSISLAAIVGIIVMLYAYVFPQFIPHGLTFVR